MNIVRINKTISETENMEMLSKKRIDYYDKNNACI